MRNLKKVLSLALAMVMLIGMMVVGASATTFSDDADIKHQEAVDVVSGIGILQGIGDGSFNPEGTLSRAEAAVVIAKLDLGAAFGNLETTNASTFDDVSVHHWGKAYIDYCAARGLIAGDGNGKFMPDDEVTGVEFGLMVSRVLGYEDANEDVSGVTWVVKAAALSRKAGLTKDVILTDKAISRDDMAQVAYNALQADMVGYDGRAIIIDNVTIPAGKAYTLANNTSAYDYVNDGELQLCEEKFPNLRLNKEAADENGRPANVWTYGTNNVISSVAHAATFEIKDGYKGAQLAKTLGKAPLLNNYSWYYYIDGEFQGSTANKNGSTMRADARANGTSISYAGTGTTTYIYVDDTVGNASVTVCEVKVYGGEVTKVTDTNVTVGDLTFETTAFKEDDVVLYTKGRDTNNGKEVIVTMEAAEKVEGTLTKVTQGSTFVVDDNTYKYNCTLPTGDKMDGANVKYAVSFYVDHDGNMVYPGTVITNADYAYVLQIVGRQTAFKDDVYYARLLKTDGSVAEVTVAKQAGWSGEHAADGLLNKIVTYTESDGQYTLTQMAASRTGSYNSSQLSIGPGVSRMRLGLNSSGNQQIAYANDDTVFLVNNGDNTYSAYKGYKNVPAISGKGASTTVAYYCPDSTEPAAVVYVAGADVDTSTSDDVIFVVGNGSARLVTENNGNKYYEFDAVVDKEVTSIKVLSGSDLAKSLRVDDVVLTFKSLKTNSKGLVTSATAHPNAPAALGTYNGTEKISSSVVGFGSTAKYAYNDETLIVKLDLAGDITVGGAELVKNDNNDRVWVVEKDGKLQAAFILEKAKDASASVDTSDDPIRNVEIDEYGPTVVVEYLHGTTVNEAREAEAALVADGYTINARNPGAHYIRATKDGITTEFTTSTLKYFSVKVDDSTYYVTEDGKEKGATEVLTLPLNMNAGTGTGYTFAKGDADAIYVAYKISDIDVKNAIMGSSSTDIDANAVFKTGYVKVDVQRANGTALATIAVPYSTTANSADVPEQGASVAGYTGTGYEMTPAGGTASYVAYNGKFTPNKDHVFKAGYVKRTEVAVSGTETVTAVAYDAGTTAITGLADPGTVAHKGTGFVITKGSNTEYKAYGNASTLYPDADFSVAAGYVQVTYTASDGSDVSGGVQMAKVGTAAGDAYLKADGTSTLTVTVAVNAADAASATANSFVTLADLTVSADSTITGGTDRKQTVTKTQCDDGVVLTWTVKAGTMDINLKATLSNS